MKNIKKAFLLLGAVSVVLTIFTSAKVLFAKDKVIPDNKEVVVLLHGLGRNVTSMWLLASRLEDAGYYVHRVGYSSLDQKPDDILKDISLQINQCCQKHNQSVHFVGHSLGGLMVRAYLQNNKIDRLGKVVLLGTPNKGSEMADYFSNSCLIDLVGPTAKALGTDNNGFAQSLKLPYYPVGIIAGEMNCNLNNPVIPGKDDGLVSIEATKVDGVTDFIIIKTGHSMMRYNSEVAEQTIEFIKYGQFKEQKKVRLNLCYGDKNG